MKTIHGLLLVGCSALALAGCGPSDIASPGGGGVTINNPAPTPTPTPTTPTPTGVTPAGGCPTIASDAGTITGPTGTYRVCNLPGVISSSITLQKIPGLIYALPGRVNVGCDGGYRAPTAAAPFNTSTAGCPSSSLTSDTNVTLTIQPGVIVMATTGQAWLAVNRGNKINAVGTASQPIIFTSSNNVLGVNTDSEQGQWGGVVLMGRAPITDCNTGSIPDSCERNTEGSPSPAVYGGNDSTYNAGRMSYVQIRYSGFILGANSELQSLTGEGIGSGTTLDHIMSFNSSDDGSEFFGGSPNMKYYVSVGADDDSLDVDMGAQMNVQYALMIQRDGAGDALFEIDSNGFEGDTPRTKLNVANFTAIQRQTSSNNESNDQASALFRGNSDTTLINGLIVSPNNECIRMNGTGTTPATLNAFSVGLTCNAGKFLGTGTLTAAQVSGFFNVAGRNNNDALTSTLSGGFINGTNESAIQATDPKATSSFFDTTTWVGAVRNADDRWYAGWTCNSATANFGSGNTGACTSLPTT